MGTEANVALFCRFVDELINKRNVTVIDTLVAEGDAVVARFTIAMGNAAGETVSARGLTYYRLADGKIVEDDPITTPDLVQELGKLLPSPATS